MKWLKRLFGKKCEHDWVLATSYVHRLEETDIIQFNWCLKCDERKILNKVTKGRK